MTSQGGKPSELARRLIEEAALGACTCRFDSGVVRVGTECALHLQARLALAASQAQVRELREALAEIQGIASLHVHAPPQEGCANCRINALFAVKQWRSGEATGISGHV